MQIDTSDFILRLLNESRESLPEAVLDAPWQHKVICPEHKVSSLKIGKATRQHV